MIGDAPPPELIEWAESAVGSKVIGVDREFAGGSRPLWYLGFESGEQCVLRLDDGSGALSESPYSIQREVDVYRGLIGSAVPVPTVHAARGFDDGFVILMNRVLGDSRFPRNDPDSVTKMVESLIGAVATLHSLDVSDLKLPWPDVGSIRDGVEQEIQTWRELSEACPDPVCDYAFEWLTSHLTALTGIDSAPSLVQGDTGPGNAVFHEGALTALVDWELAHIGDPMQDIAWIITRCRQYGGDVADSSFVRASYDRVAKQVSDSQRIAFQFVFVNLKCAVITARTIAEGGGALGLNPYQLARHRFRRELLDSIAFAEVREVESVSALAERIASQVGLTDDVLNRFRAALPALNASSSAEKLAVRDRNLGLLNQTVSQEFSEKLLRITQGGATGAEFERLSALVACDSLLWPEVAASSASK